MRNNNNYIPLALLLLASLLFLSSAIDTLGSVPEYLTLPRPPFINQTGGYQPLGSSESPLGWDIKTTLERSQITEINQQCGTEDIPLFNITGVTSTRYIRVKLGEIYDGEWYMINSTKSIYNGEPIQNKGEGKPRNIYISPEGEITSYLPSVTNVYQLQCSQPIIYFPEKTLFRTQDSLNEEYQVTYNLDTETHDDLVDANLVYNIQYLQVPYEVQTQLFNMTQEIVRGIDSDYLKIQAIESYLQRNYVYNLNYTSPQEDEDPVLWFLFQSREGICIHYNSALVLMARSIGLPMRLVAGFSVNPNTYFQTVKPDQAHAWAEADFKGIGWVTFDATPGSFNAEQQTPGLINTNTTITHQDPRCYKGDSFSVTGTVTDQNGVPVNGLTTLIYIKEDKEEEGILCGKGVSENNFYSINCSIPLNTQPSEYLLEAITLGNTRYNGSDSDPPIEVLARSYLDVNKTARIIANREYNIKGRLLETLTQNPITAQGLYIIIPRDTVWIRNGALTDIVSIQTPHLVTTNLNGEFDINQVFTPGNHTVEVTWEGSLFYNGTRETMNITAVPLTITPTPLDAFARGKLAKITGLVHAEELIPASGERVDIYQDDEYLGSAFTSKDGLFNYTYMIPTSIAVQDIQISYIIGDGEYVTNQSNRIAVQPKLNYLPRGVGTWEKPLQIEAVLLDDTGAPMRYADLTLTIAGNQQVLTTDTEGRVLFQVKLDSRPESDLISFSIDYPGASYTIPVKVLGSIQLDPVINYTTILTTLIIALTAIGLGYGAYSYIKKRPKTTKQTHPQDIINEITSEKDPETGVYIVKDLKARIQIRLPDLTANQPLIWGISEPLDLDIELWSESSEQNSEIRLESPEINKIIETDNSGKARISLVFEKTGFKNLSFNYQNPATEANAETLLVIKIVDYREEIVKEFNQDFRTQIEKHGELIHTITAREMLDKISSQIEPRKADSIKTMVHTFEEATYSLHPITANNYNQYIQARQRMEA